MILRLGVFEARGGSILAEAGWMERFETRDAALHDALRRAQVARWRGEEAEVLAQDAAGEPLLPVRASSISESH